MTISSSGGYPVAESAKIVALLTTLMKSHLKLKMCDRCAGSLEQRKDDSAATVHHRLETYHEKTKPLIDYYGKLGIILAVDTSGTPEESFSKACSLLDSMKIER